MWAKCGGDSSGTAGECWVEVWGKGWGGGQGRVKAQDWGEQESLFCQERSFKCFLEKIRQWCESQGVIPFTRPQGIIYSTSKTLFRRGCWATAGPLPGPQPCGDAG